MNICEVCEEEYSVKPVKPIDGDKFKYPEIRTRDNIPAYYVSDGYIKIESVNIPAASTEISSTLAVVEQQLRISQLPSASVKAHFCIRDIFTVFNTDVDGQVDITAFLCYEDVSGRRHVLDIIAVNSLISYASGSYTFNTNLIVSVPFSDARPANFGKIVLEIINLAFGTATLLRYNARLNYAIYYEA